MFQRAIFLAIITLLITCGVGGPSFAQDEAAILRYPIASDPETLNPFLATTQSSATIMNTIYEGLVTLDIQTGQAVPHLAESIELSQDKLTYTFHLRKGVRFHKHPKVVYQNEAREFTADDWIFAAKYSLTSDTSISLHPEWLDGVVGAAEFKEGKADDIAGIRKIDDYTIEIRLLQPNRLFLFSLGVPAIAREAIEQLGEELARNPVGTGPYQLVEWKSDDHLMVEAFPDYWQPGKPVVSRVEFLNVPDPNTALLLYRQDKLDFLFTFPPGQRTTLVTEFADQYNERAGYNVRYFGFKMSTGFFAEHPKVRQAFSHAFNRELVWKELMEGARLPGTIGALPPPMNYPPPALTYPYDLEKAATLLSEAGFPEGKGIPPIKLYVFSAAKDELSLPVLQDDLRKLGVELEIVVEDGATYWSHIGQDDAWFFLSGWSPGISDPADVFNYLFFDGRDDTKYSNDAVNSILRAALAEFDPDKRRAMYIEAHDLIMADAPIIVSAYGKVSWLQKPWIEGFVPAGGGTYTARIADIKSGKD